MSIAIQRAVLYPATMKMRRTENCYIGPVTKKSFRLVYASVSGIEKKRLIDEMAVLWVRAGGLRDLIDLGRRR